MGAISGEPKIEVNVTMLFTLDGKQVNQIPRTRAEYFDTVIQLLGTKRREEIRGEFNRLIDSMSPNERTGKRTFSSSYLGSSLTPWSYPLSHLYDVAVQMEGDHASEDQIQEQSGFSFGLFAWECIIARDEKWTFYDPNLSGDLNKEITGKVYFER